MANIYITDEGQANAPDNNVKKDIQPVPRQLANLEAEKGEVVVGDLVGIGIPQSYKIGGKRHSEGGSPLDVEEGSFIFSDTNDMKFKKKQDADILALFGETETKTPAEIAKKYDMNESIKILLDKDSDTLDRETAEMNINNYKEKLGLLALAQEGKKGFPDGVPEIAEDVAEKYGINPLVQKVQGIEERQQQQPNDGQYAEGGELEQAELGKDVKVKGVDNESVWVEYTDENNKSVLIPIPKDVYRGYGSNNFGIIYGNADNSKNLISGNTYYDTNTGKFYKVNSVDWTKTGNVELPVAGQNSYSTGITHDPSRYGQIILENTLRNKEGENNLFNNLGNEIKYLINDKEYSYNVNGEKKTAKGLHSVNEYNNYWVDKSNTKKGYNILGKEHLDKLKGIKDNSSEYLNNVVNDFLKVNALNLQLINYLDNETARKALTDRTNYADNQKGIADYLDSLNNTEASKLAEQVRNLSKEEVANFQLAHVAMNNLNNNDGSSFKGKLYNNAYGDAEEMLGDAFKISKIGSIYGDNTSRQINALNWLNNNGIELNANPKLEEIRPAQPLNYTDNVEGVRQQIPAPFYLQDLNNVANAAWNRANIRKYTPWQAPLEYEPYRPVFTDFRGAAARSSAQLNNALQTASAFGPEAFLASFNQMAGKAAENIGQFQEYEDRYNTQVDNDARKTNWQGYNNFLGRKATWDTGLYDKYTIANQQYDNAIKQANQQLVNTINNAYTNRAKQHNQNTMFDNYWIDPRNGGMIEFYSNRDTLPVNHQQSFADQISSLYQSLKDSNPELDITFDDALKAYKYMTEGADDDDLFESAMKSMMNAYGRRRK